MTWNEDYDFEEFGIECEGTVYTYVCRNCGTEIDCFVPRDKEWDR